WSVWAERALYARTPVHDRRRSLIDVAVVYVTGHTNHLVPRSDPHHANALANRRRRPTPQFAGHGGRHHDHRPTIKDVGPREVAASNQWDSECREETWRHVFRAAHGRYALRDRLALGSHGHAVFEFGLQRQRTGERGSGDAGESGESIENVLLHPYDTVGVWNLRLRDREAHRLHLGRRREAGLNVPQCLECSNHQSGCHEEHDGQTDLHDQQRMLSTVSCRTVTDVAAS